MGIELPVQSDQCDKCNKPNTEVGEITYYTKYNQKRSLCKNCIKDIETHYTKKCPKCNQTCWNHGGLIEYNKEKMCSTCKDKIKKKSRDRQKIKQFFISHWQYWIIVGIGTLGLLIAKQLI